MVEEKDKEAQKSQQNADPSQPVTEAETSLTSTTNAATEAQNAFYSDSSQEEEVEENNFFGQMSDIMTATSRSVQEIKQNLEPKEELRFLARVLKEAAIKDRMGKDQAFAEYLYETLAIQLAMRCAKETSADDEYLEVCADMLESIMDVFLVELQNKRYNQEFYCAVTWCFQPVCSLHQNNFQMGKEELRSLSLKAMRTQTWRESLQVGDLVDVKVEVGKKMIKGWIQGTIVSIDEDDQILVNSPQVEREIQETEVERWSSNLAQFESKTAEDYTWRQKSLVNASDFVVDMHDDIKWEEGTIFQTKMQSITNQDPREMAYCAFRVYRDWGDNMKRDERGQFDGWSRKYDEWIPIYSPRIQPHLSRKGQRNVLDDDEQALDDFYRPVEPGMKRVFVVPRVLQYFSKKFLYFINKFGNNGGYDLIYDVICNGKTGDGQELTLTTLCYLITLLSMPSHLLHKDFAAEVAGKFVDAIINQTIVNCDDKHLKEIKHKNIFEQIIVAVRRLKMTGMPKQQALQETNIFKLKFVKKCLQSEYLEKRIMGIKDLNDIIDDVTSEASAICSPEFLVQWMTENDIFRILWDPKKTHLQLVQRSDEIVKMLMRSELLNETLIEQFWGLSRSEYKSEVFKIMTQSNYLMDQLHVEYLFCEITKIAPAKLSLDEFNLLCQLGRRSNTEEFRNRVGNFFWNVIREPSFYSKELLDTCISKCADLMGSWTMKTKKPFFDQLPQSALNFNTPFLPMIQLFEKIIKQQDFSVKENKKWSDKQAALSKKENKEAFIESENLILTLLKDKQLFATIIQNLSAYIDKANQIYKTKMESEETKKDLDDQMCLVSDKYTHAEEIESRLSFIQTLYENCRQVSLDKSGLEALQDVLNKSQIPSDQTFFLEYCKKFIKIGTTTSALDIEIAGQYFCPLLEKDDLSVTNLTLDGFEFFEQIFVGVNEKEKNLMQILPKPKKTTKKDKDDSGQDFMSTYTALWGQDYGQNKDEQEEENQDQVAPSLTVFKIPFDLQHIDLLWKILMKSESEHVYGKALQLLVTLHLSLDSDSFQTESRLLILKQFLNQVFEQLNEDRKDITNTTISHTVGILQEIIAQSEINGTAGVKPHSALLNGELFERVIIKFYAEKRDFYGNRKLERTIVVKCFSNVTVWEFKLEVAQILNLAPRYLQFKLPSDDIISQKQNGMLLSQIGVKNGDIFSVQKVTFDEQIEEVPIIDEEKNELTEKARQIFTTWFHLYKDVHTNQMDKFAVARFVSVATGASCYSSEEPVRCMIQQYDTNGDEALSLEDFLTFYLDAASGSAERREAVRNNLKNHNIRPDLKSFGEVFDNPLFDQQSMPRELIAQTSTYFDTLTRMLEQKSLGELAIEPSVLDQIWQLVRMLSTNKITMQRVQQLQTEKDEFGNTDWSLFFEGSSVEMRSYVQDIVLSILQMIDQKKKLTNQMVQFVEETITTSAGSSSKVKQAEQSNEIDNDENSTTLDSTYADWTKNFLEQGGFDEVLTRFLQIDANTRVGTQIKELEFLTTLVRVFLVAAFSGKRQDRNIDFAVSLVRKSSSIQDEASLARKNSSPQKQSEAQSDDQLQQLMKGQLGEQIRIQVDNSQMQERLIQILACVLKKQSLKIIDKTIVENALSLWAGLILYEPTLFNEFIETQNGPFSPYFTSATELIIEGLISCQEEKIRSDLSQALIAIVQNLKGEQKMNATNFLLGILCQNFHSIKGQSCRQYFDVLNILVNMKAIQSDLTEFDQEQANNLDKLLSQVVDMLIEEQMSNKGAEETKDKNIDIVLANEQAQEKDRLLTGLYKLTGRILVLSSEESVSDIVTQKDLVSQIFRQFLFPSHFQSQESSSKEEAITISVQKGSRKQSQGQGKQSVGKGQEKARKAAFDLLIQLIKSSQKVMSDFLMKQMLTLMANIKPPKKWNFKPDTSAGTEKSQLYVGLRNLGCICYMNSMMQQFFMIPAFRYNLLCVDDEKNEELVEYKGEKIDDNMLHQMQKLIAHLELSTRNDYNPLGFCFSFKEFDGTPTNVVEQKDASEFLTILFDRLENALKPTPRKYLLQSIFGGKYCSQMVCTECGKVKNRQEDFYFLSLDVKDIKSVNESLSKQVEGEIISDYQCDGCNRKVDLSKRTLIAETPNILIVHLKRLVFNFDTFQNDKLNTQMSFPTVLDLKPYSYFDVMEKEGRLNKGKKSNEAPNSESQTGDEGEEMTEEEKQKKKEADEDAKDPPQDDCFEYKLVGVNVHSGSANSGHYWSYINTNRGFEEGECPDWIKTEKDPWMEFNDHTVSDWDFSKIKTDAFGNSEESSDMLGETYGQSGYMLFYERRQKKPIKLLVAEDQVQAEKDAGVDIFTDEEKNESFKMVKYRAANENIKPNQIYQKVFEDNHKLTFENDVYSPDFFKFILEVLQIVPTKDAQSQDEQIQKLIKTQLLLISKKLGFEILARCSNSSGIEVVAQAMINILKTDDQLCIKFLQILLNDNRAELVIKILLDCPEKKVQKEICRVIKYLLCKVKVLEKEKILTNELEEIEMQFVDKEGNLVTNKQYQPASLASRFMNIVFDNLFPRAARCWHKFDSFLDLILGFAIHSPEELAQETKRAIWQRNSEAYHIGMDFYFRNNVLVKMCDFFLNEESPLVKRGEKRQTMGGYITEPNFESLLKLVGIMISDKELVKKYDALSGVAKDMIQHKKILSEVMDMTDQADCSNMVAQMSFNNEKLSKKMAKSAMSNIRNPTLSVSKVKKMMQQLGMMLLIDDSLKQTRLEWILGVGQIIVTKDYSSNSKVTLYGKECCEFVNDQAYGFKSSIVKGDQCGLLEEIFLSKRFNNSMPIQGVLELCRLCIADDQIAEFVYKSPAPTYQHARYTDWFESFTKKTIQKQEQLGKGAAISYSTTQQVSYSETLSIAEEVLRLLPKLNEKLAKFEQKWVEEKIKMNEKTEFLGQSRMWMAGKNGEVISHFPPQVIIGRQTHSQEEILAYEGEAVSVKLVEMRCEYGYGNPTGDYNLSMPELAVKDNGAIISYVSHKQFEMTGQNSDNQAGIDQEEQQELAKALDIKPWDEYAQIGEPMATITLQNHSGRMLKAYVHLEADGEQDEKTLNCVLPKNPFIVQSFAQGGVIRPVAGILQKIDPTKPLGKFRMSVETKFYQTGIRGPGGSVYIGEDGEYVTTHKNSSTRFANDSKNAKNREDPTQSDQFKEKINSLQIQNQIIRAQKDKKDGDSQDVGDDFEDISGLEVKGIGLGGQKNQQSNLTEKDLARLEKIKQMNEKRRVGFTVDIPESMRNQQRQQNEDEEQNHDQNQLDLVGDDSDDYIGKQNSDNSIPSGTSPRGEFVDNQDDFLGSDNDENYEDDDQANQGFIECPCGYFNVEQLEFCPGCKNVLNWNTQESVKPSTQKQTEGQDSQDNPNDEESIEQTENEQEKQKENQQLNPSNQLGFINKNLELD